MAQIKNKTNYAPKLRKVNKVFKLYLALQFIVKKECSDLVW